MKEKLYTIGEISKLMNISIKALRYYDKIDLFKAAYVDPDTNYRYYKDSQIYPLCLHFENQNGIMNDEISGQKTGIKRIFTPIYFISFLIIISGSWAYKFRRSDWNDRV